MFSFVKELDDTTLWLARHLTEKQRQLKPGYRNLRFVLVWVDGDEEKLTAWATKNGLTELPLYVVAAHDETLQKWQLNPMAMSTIVFLNRRTATDKLIDLSADDESRIDEQITKHVQNFPR